MKITVGICTWNRADLLDQTLAGMHDLQIPNNHDWELLVVNNNCTDHTDEVLDKHRNSLPLQKLFESKSGQSNARNCALDAASGELLIWTDDDVLVDKNWLAAFVDAAHEYPDYAFFGGAVRPWYTTVPPKWIEVHLSKIRGAFALKDYGCVIRPFELDEQPVGASMAIRMSVQKRYRYDPNLGHTQNLRLGGDEKDLFRRLEAAGHRGLWVGTSILQHYMHPTRLCASHVSRWFAQVAINDSLRSPSSPANTVFGIERWMLRAYFGWWIRERTLRPFKNENWLNALIRLSQIRGMIKASRLKQFSSRSSKGN